jgi:hypothetical protein
MESASEAEKFRSYDFAHFGICSIESFLVCALTLEKNKIERITRIFFIPILNEIQFR